MEQITALRKAIDQFGSQTQLAAAIGYSQHAVWHAIQRGQVSARMAAAIHKATKGRIRKDQLRPDIFGDMA
jgi:DNA-binding transcriptional regulator YdaS (Cro superfamily)